MRERKLFRTVGFELRDPR